jgi:hypothetical protein
MAVEFPKTIVLKSLYGRKDEGRAAEAVTPGHLIDLDVNLKVVKHATAAAVANVLPRFAIEDGLAGKTIEDAYAANDLVFLHYAQEGDEIYALLDAGENVAANAVLESAGNGNLQAVTTGRAIAKTLEAVDATAATKRVKVQILG